MYKVFLIFQKKNFKKKFLVDLIYKFSHMNKKTILLHVIVNIN